MFSKRLLFSIFMHSCVSVLSKIELKESIVVAESISLGNTIDNTIGVSNSVENKLIIQNNTESSRKHILMFHPWGTRSHMQQLTALLDGLLKSGNDVTGVFARKTEIVHQHYTEIIVKDG